MNILILSNLTHLISMADLIAISLETPKMNNRFSLENEFIELIYMKH